MHCDDKCNSDNEYLTKQDGCTSFHDFNINGCNCTQLQTDQSLAHRPISVTWCHQFVSTNHIKNSKVVLLMIELKAVLSRFVLIVTNA